MSLVKEPVYYQLNIELKKLLKSDDYPSGSKFMTEREIARKYTVSRATANKALASLVSEGLLEFKKGIGTFVREQPLENELTSLVSFTRRAKEAGLEPETQVHSFAPVDIKEMGWSTDEESMIPDASYGISLKRLRLASEVPVILEHRHLLLPQTVNISREDVQDSLYSMLSDKGGFWITRVEQSIRAVSLNEEEAKLLQVAPSFPALEIRAVTFRDMGIPLWRERTLYRSDKYEFVNRLGVQPQRMHSSSLVSI